MPSSVGSNSVNQPAWDERREALQQLLEGLEAPLNTLKVLKDESHRWDVYMQGQGKNNRTQQFLTAQETTRELREGLQDLEDD